MDRLAKLSPFDVNDAEWQASIIADRLENFNKDLSEQKITYPYDAHIIIEWNNRIPINGDVVKLLKRTGWYVYEEIDRSRDFIYHKLLILPFPINQSRFMADFFQEM
jgi:hypothetical protein